MTDNNSFIIKNLLSPKEFRKCEIIFNGNKNFKKGWNCFNNGVSWIQFFHDILLLCNGIRSAVLIDYAVPEWDDLCEFLNHIKSSSVLSNIIGGNQLSNIQLVHLDDYLFFIVNLETLVEKSNVDIGNSFTNYLFIDVSTHNTTPLVCNDPTNHHQLLSKLINIISTTNKGENIILSNDENISALSLTKQYYPIISGWLCEYPIIYCNSGCFKQCSLIDTTSNDQETFETLLKHWENNNLCGDELTKFEVSIKQPNNQNYISVDILKILSIQRICSFTYPVSISNEKIEQVLSNYENRIIQRFNSSTIFKELWLNILFIKQTISMTTIRL